MDYDLFKKMLSVDSTSGRENALAEKLEQWFAADGCTVQRLPGPESDGGRYNLLFSWGKPEIVFCTHMDTVPPYLPPVFDGDIAYGRGTCDAKGQILALHQACQTLAQRGEKDFALLLVYGEETSSLGAKALRDALPEGECVIVGEPTDNMMVSASKGTKAFEVIVRGKSCHSGYPENGRSAIEGFVDMVNDLRSRKFPVDPILGETTWNIGKLRGDNAQNVLSPELTCRVYFRTTFATDQMVGEVMNSMQRHGAEVKALGGDTPLRYLTLDGFKSKPVAFGSDAPYLTMYKHRIICGAGSILVAHTDNECVRLSDLEEAADNYVKMFYLIRDGLK